MNLCIVCNVSKKANGCHVCKICQNEQFERLRERYGRAGKERNYYEQAIPYFEQGKMLKDIAEILNISASYVFALRERWRNENVKEAK